MTKSEQLEELRLEHENECKHCVPQADAGLNFVFGEGDVDARLMFVGEGPGAEEDAQGRPFVGRAGKMLDKQIEAVGLKREEVYIANIVKVRPPDNRVPTPEEATLCIPYLKRQIAIVKPNVIIGLGATSVKYLLQDKSVAITKLRGSWQSFEGVPLMPTLHPAYLVRAYTAENRKNVHEDLRKALAKAKA